MRGFLQRRLVQPLLQLLRLGVTPEKIALSLAVGVVLGTFPVLGSTTILCTLAVFALGLNFASIQIVNYLVYPLQLALLVPLLRAGQILFRALWTATLHAMVAWAILAIPMILLLNVILRPVIRRLSRGLGALKRSASGSAAGVDAPAQARITRPLDHTAKP
jgi:hypothetical protein